MVIENFGGVIALSDLPAHSSLSIDAGCNHTLRNSEPLLIVHHITPAFGFHFVVVRGCTTHKSRSRSQSPSESCSSHTPVLVVGEDELCPSSVSLHAVGLVLLFPQPEPPPSFHGTLSDHHNKHSSIDWLVVRKYDPYIEEVSSEIIQDTTAIENFILDIPNSESTQSDFSFGQSRFVGYSNLINDTNGNNSLLLWSQCLTHYIQMETLQRHGLTGNGDKIVPGLYKDDLHNDTKKDYLDSPTSTSNNQMNNDGVCLQYPSIPCIDRNEQVQHHKATRKYLTSLSSLEKTNLLFHCNNPGSQIFQYVIETIYGGKWELLLGDFQLSFVLVLCLECLTSLEFWRDLLTMISLVQRDIIETYTLFFEHLLVTLHGQMERMERDLFDELEYSEGTFLRPTLIRLIQIMKESNCSQLFEPIRRLECSVGKKLSLSIGTDIQNDSNSDESAECDVPAGLPFQDSEDDDSDAPVIVDMEEIDASLKRIHDSELDIVCKKSKETIEDCGYQKSYPLLFAATMDHEDVLMACARILDEKVDVSLVREAAAYLENVEAKR